MPRHPDTISDLAPDCRRVLRDDYLRIQVAQTATPRYDNVRGESVPPDPHAVGRAIAEYRRVAALWGVDVG